MVLLCFVRMLAEGKRTVALFEVQQQTRLVSSKQKMLLLSNLETELENELMVKWVAVAGEVKKSSVPACSEIQL